MEWMIIPMNNNTLLRPYRVTGPDGATGYAELCSECAGTDKGAVRVRWTRGGEGATIDLSAPIEDTESHGACDFCLTDV